MARTVPVGLLALMQSDAWSPAILVKVTRTDGVESGYTSADIDITYSGLVYTPDDGIKMTALQGSLGQGVDNSQVSGFTEAARFDPTLIDRHAYEGATFTAMLCDFTNIGAGVMVLNAGFVGEITVTDEQFDADMAGLSSILKRIRGDVTTKKCRCRHLGDICCKLPLAGNVQSLGMGAPHAIQVSKTVTVVTTQKTMTFGAEAAPSTFFNQGYVKFTTGLNTGIEMEIKSHTLSAGSAVIQTVLPLPFTIAPGDVATLTAGCNRKLKYDDVAGPGSEPRIASTCSEFGNGANHHGEHFLPGNDAITKVASFTIS